MTDSPNFGGCAWIIAIIVAGALFFTVMVGQRDSVTQEAAPPVAITAVAP